MSWDHYLPRWVIRGFRDSDGNYYTLQRGAKKPHRQPLKRTAARLDMNKTKAPNGTVFDSEDDWSEWDTPAGEMASRVAGGDSPATDLSTVVVWATSLPLRGPFWRDAAAQETDAHESNAGSLYIARAAVAPQVVNAFRQDAVSSEILRASADREFISGDCGCVFVNHDSSLPVSPSFVLPWDVNSFKPSEPEPDYSTAPKPLSAYASITPKVAIHFQFVSQGQGGDGGIRLLTGTELDEYNARFLRVAREELYGTRDTLQTFSGRF